MRAGSAWLDRRRRRRSEPHAAVLMYHRVARASVDPWELCVTPERFQAQMDVLARHAEIVPLAQIHDRLRTRAHGKPVVAITFDDGYVDNLKRAAPILRRFGAPATVFLATGYLGQSGPYWWDELADLVLTIDRPPSVALVLQSSSGRFDWNPAHASGSRWRDSLHRRLWDWLVDQPEATRRRLLTELREWSRNAAASGDSSDGARPMSATEVAELVADGLIHVGAHTHSHARLSRLAQADKVEDIRLSREACGHLTGSPPRCFAYPNGDLDDDSVRVVGELGFEVACTSRQDLVWASSQRLQTPRIVIGNWTGDEFERRLFRYWLN